MSEQEFLKYHPEGLYLGDVTLQEFDKKLCHFSRRDEGELWELGSQNKLAYLIVYLSEGLPISPPVAKPTDNNEVILIGGHHRYAIAKSIGENDMPICVCPEHKSRVNEIINVKWKHTKQAGQVRREKASRALPKSLAVKNALTLQRYS